MIALIGITIERNVTISSRNASVSTNPKTSGVFRASIVLWSRSIAVWPLTLTLTLSTVPSVAGISRSRSVVSACFEAWLVPLPASGIDSTCDGVGLVGGDVDGLVHGAALERLAAAGR